MDKIKNYLIKICIFIGVLILSIYFVYIPIIIFNININSFSTIGKILYQFICDIIAMIILYFIYRKVINKNFLDYFKNLFKNFEDSFKYYIIGLSIMIVSSLIIAFFFSDATAGNEEAVRSLISEYPIYMLFSVSIYAPFVEELVFRKSIKDIVLVNGDNKIKKYIYIILSGLIFAGMHFVGQVEKSIDLIYIIPYAALGISFATAYYKSDNIFSTIMLHCMHNTATIILYFIAGGL